MGSAQEFDGIRILGRFRQIVFFQPDCRHALAFSSRYRRFFSRIKLRRGLKHFGKFAFPINSELAHR